MVISMGLMSCFRHQWSKTTMSRFVSFFYFFLLISSFNFFFMTFTPSCQDPPVRLSIDHSSTSEIEEDSDGVWSIVGGKVKWSITPSVCVSVSSFFYLNKILLLMHRYILCWIINLSQLSAEFNFTSDICVTVWRNIVKILFK